MMNRADMMAKRTELLRLLNGMPPSDAIGLMLAVIDEIACSSPDPLKFFDHLQDVLFERIADLTQEYERAESWGRA